MIPYTGVSAVLNYIPQAMLNDVDPVQIQSWVYQAYREYQLPFTEDTKVAILNVQNHKAKLPADVLRITEVLYSQESYPTAPGYDTVVIGENKLLMYQQIFFEDPQGFFKRMKPLMYLGQMRGSLITEELYCNTCKLGFSVDARMQCLTIDANDGALTIVYKTPVKEGSEFLVPDDSTLLRGLSAFAQSEYWREKAFSHEQNSFQMQQNAMAEATNLLQKFKGKRMLAGFNPAKHREFLFSRNRKPRR